MQNYEKIFTLVKKQYNFTYSDDNIAYGWKKKSAGRIATYKNQKIWIKVQTRNYYNSTRSYNDRLWIGHEEINKVEGIKKPQLYEVYESVVEGEVVKLFLMEYCDTKPVSTGLELTVKPEYIDQKWLEGLYRQLEKLEKVRTERQGFREEYIIRRIRQYFPNAKKLKIQNWTANHCDIHWSNITTNGTILDWEAWGLASKGHDIATLLVRSLKIPKLKELINTVGKEKLITNDGRIAQLHICAEIQFMHENYNDYSEELVKLVKMHGHGLEEKQDN